MRAITTKQDFSIHTLCLESAASPAARASFLEHDEIQSEQIIPAGTPYKFHKRQTLFFEKQILVVKLIFTTRRIKQGKKPLLEQICIERWVSCGVWKLEWSKDMGKGFLQWKNLLKDTLGEGGEK